MPAIISIAGFFDYNININKIISINEKYFVCPKKLISLTNIQRG